MYLEGPEAPALPGRGLGTEREALLGRPVLGGRAGVALGGEVGGTGLQQEQQEHQAWAGGGSG